MVNTSGWKYVGLILDNVLGYLGMGDTVYTPEDDKDQSIGAIVSALNGALDFGFSRFELGTGRAALRAFYYRDSYDAVSRNDVFGGELTVMFPLSASFFMGGAAEIGFMHFNSVSPYFSSRYNDTWFYKFSYLMLRGEASGIISVHYDGMRHWGITAAVDFGKAFTFMGSPNLLIRNYQSGGVDTEEFSGGAVIGIRYRSGGISAIKKHREMLERESKK